MTITAFIVDISLLLLFDFSFYYLLFRLKIVRLFFFPLRKVKVLGERVDDSAVQKSQTMLLLLF